MGGQNKNIMQQVVNELLGLMHQLVKSDASKEQILELTDADTSYRRNVNAEHNDDKVILSIVTEIIEEYKNQVAGTVL